MSSVLREASVSSAPSSTASRPRGAEALMGLRQTDEARVMTRIIERLACTGPGARAPAQSLGSRVVILDGPSPLAGVGSVADLVALSVSGTVPVPSAPGAAANVSWSDPAVLGPFIGKGHFHRAFALDQVGPSGMRQPGSWMALIAVDAPSHQEPTLRRYYHALGEHRHAHRLTAVTPELLPAYAGLAAVLPVDQRHQERTLRFATIWQRKDATFQQVVDAGGVAGRATIQDREFTAADVGRAMLLIGRAYQKLHDHDMVYTDPKPANLAFSLHDPGEPRSPRRSPGTAHANSPTPAASMIRDVVFIDAESMQPPGYARDPERRAVTIMTPPMVAEDVLRGVSLGGGMPLKRAQATAKNDVFHTAVIAYGLVTGDIPQLAMGRQRYQQRCDELKRRGGFEPKEAEQVLIDEFRLTRLLEGFEHEHAQLARNVRAARIPQSLAQVVSDGLSGRIHTFGEWERRTLAMSGEPSGR